MQKIKKLFNKTNIILSVILIGLIALITYNKSVATNYSSLSSLLNEGKVGDTINIGFNSLASTDYSNPNHLYCVQRHASINDAVKYGVEMKIKIEGNYAESTDFNTETNQYRTSNNITNGVLAYILGGGNYQYGYGSDANTHTTRQNELWGFWNEWLSNGGKELGMQDEWEWRGNDGSKDKNLEEEALNYASNNNGGIAEIISNSGTNVDSNNELAGPFNVKYSGTISSIEVKDTNGNVVDSEFAYMQGDKQVNIQDIISGEDFYISNWSGKILKDMTIKVTSSVDVISVNLMLLSNASQGQQKLMYAEPKRETKTTEANITIGISSPNNVLRVVKHQSENTDVRQQGVGFIVNKQGTGYLKKNNNKTVKTGKMEYNTTDFSWTGEREDATIFETVNTEDNWKGYFQLSGIPTGTYYIGEVYNNNNGYEQSTISRSVLEKYKNDNLISSTQIGNIQQNENLNNFKDNKLQVMTVNIENDGYTKVLRVYDKKPGTEEKFGIQILKTAVNSDTNRLVAHFKIKVLENGKPIGWLAENDKGYIYTAAFNGAKDFKTLTSGALNITKLNTDYEYELFETQAPSGYYPLANQIVNDSRTGKPISSAMTVSINNELVDEIEYITSKNGRTTSTESNNFANVSNTIYCGTVSYKDYGKTAYVKATNRKQTGGGSGRRRRIFKH